MLSRLTPRPRSALPALLVVAALLLGVSAVARADAPPERRTRIEAALKRLSSPVLEERREGVATLVALLPGVRGRVIEALPKAPWSVQVHLIEVLGQDGSEAAIQALLEHLTRTEATQALLIQTKLAANRSASLRLLAAWRKDRPGFVKRAGTGVGPERLRALVRLLRRAEIEELFVGRKSKSGSTGYYKGQYDILRGKDKNESGYRAQALEIVAGIALDEAIRTTGIYTSGVYRFVREHFVDEWELKSMALNAVGELCTPDDKKIIARLERRLVDLMGERAELFDRMQRRRRAEGDAYDSKPFQDALMEWDDALGEYLDHLTCLHAIEPERYAGFVHRFDRELRNFQWPYVPLRRWSYIAALRIRAGLYEQALEAYRRSMQFGGSRALGFYNMACASASASLKVGLSAGRRRGYLEDAMMYLSLSVDEGWSDVAWMNEDRDLDPLRKHRASAYAHVVERIKREWHVPKEDPDDKKDGR